MSFELSAVDLLAAVLPCAAAGVDVQWPNRGFWLQLGNSLENEYGIKCKGRSAALMLCCKHGCDSEVEVNKKLSLRLLSLIENTLL